MSRLRLLPVLGILGLVIAGGVVMADNRHAPIPLPPVEPAQSPYASFVAGAGIVEASTGDISVGTPVAGIATAIAVRVGQHVHAGDILFRVDDRDLRAQLETAKARVNLAAAKRLQPQHRLAYAENLSHRTSAAVTEQTLGHLRDELAVADANLALARAQVSQLRAAIRRRIVRAPVGGTVLQLKLRLGEYVSGASAPVLMFGDERRLFVRVNVDESDAWRVQPGAPATAFMRGNANLRTRLRFEYIEPALVPKRSLTGSPTERTDTRVLQVLYSFPAKALPAYVGQQLDVFIQAAPADRRAGSKP